MKTNHDSIFAVLTPDTFGGRPTSDFFTLNSLYGAEYSPEDSELDVNHYSQAYQDYSLENLPIFGTYCSYSVYAFYTHTGTQKIRFTAVENQLVPTGTPIERIAIRSEPEQAIKLACVKYATLGTWIIIGEEYVYVF